MDLQGSPLAMFTGLKTDGFSSATSGLNIGEVMANNTGDTTGLSSTSFP